MHYKKKLIEVALPLEAINTQSAREKSIRHGHPSTLHLWWARRPLAAARAVIWASLVDDPSSLPEQFPTEEEQNAERKRLFDILTELVKWENSNNQEVLNAAKAEIMKSTNNNPPALLDPFAGGGAIPLEAQRLGLEAHASDLNPVAVMINKAMIEIPPKFAGQPPVNPDAKLRQDQQWTGAQGLAEDVRYYGEWMKKKAFERIGHLYPKVKDEHGNEHTVIAWIWARTVKCQNPACGCEMPLVSNFALSKKTGKEVYIQPVVEDKNISYEIKEGKDAPEPTKTARGANFKCVCCNEAATPEYIKTEALAKRMGAVLMAIVAEGKKGRLYYAPNLEHIKAAKVKLPDQYPTGAMPKNPRWFSPPDYGFPNYEDIFTNRQLNALTSFSTLVSEAQKQIENDGGSPEYAQSVSVYLAFVIDKMVDYHSSICVWHTTRDLVANTMRRQAIQMTWDYAEANPFCNSSGCFDNMLGWVTNAISKLPTSNRGGAFQRDAQTDNGYQHILVSTDPPYYDNIGYADLSDYFYIWMRQALKETYPDLFRTMLVPKAEELVATPYRFDGSKAKAYRFFETGMLEAFTNINKYARNDFPTTVYYAYRQSENDDGKSVASTGWETMLAAMIYAGFSITGTWPVRTELTTALKGSVNALASSIVLVCRKRPSDAPSTSRRAFINELRAMFASKKDGLPVLLSGNISPVDLPQSSIGPGMAVYSKYSEVLEADGTPMSVRDALILINQELDAFLVQQEGRMDTESRFCVAWFEQFGLASGKYGDAENMARARLANLQALVDDGVLESGRSIVRLKRRDELPDKWDISHENTIWTIVQRLCRSLETQGLDATAAHMLNLSVFDSSKIENAKNLAYRAYIAAERKGWADEALAYNSLVTAWPDLIVRMNKLKDITPEQMQLEF